MPVSKYTIMKKINHLTCLRDMMGQTCPIRAFASTYHVHHFIVSQYIFMLTGSKGFLGNTWKKLDTLGRNFKGKITQFQTTLSQNIPHLIAFKILIFILEYRALCTLLAIPFFPLK